MARPEVLPARTFTGGISAKRSLRVVNGQLSDQALDARVVARLVDAHDEHNVGWLYLDEDGFMYVVLPPHAAVTEAPLYQWFGMPQYNWNRPDVSTEPVVQHEFRLPPGIKIRSCTGD